MIFDYLVFSENWQELVRKVKSAGMRPGVALKPGTPVEEVYPLVMNESFACVCDQSCYFKA